MALPGWAAWTVTAPWPCMVSTVPLMVAGPNVTLKDTGKPEDAEAERVNGGSVVVCVGIGGKEID